MKRLPLVLAGTLLVAVIWFLWPRPEEEPDPGALPPSPRASLRSPDTPPAPEPRSPLADTLNAPGGDIHADLRGVLDVITAFRTNFPHAGNPTGTNAEITAALTGRNPLRLALIPPGHSAINPAGELCDRWGTPLFFHAESATRMEVRSAGPDRRLWTDDDVGLTP
jgi:hypothetical protein